MILEKSEVVEWGKSRVVKVPKFKKGDILYVLDEEMFDRLTTKK